jgi:hypothetical protein
MLMCDVISEQ